MKIVKKVSSDIVSDHYYNLLGEDLADNEGIKNLLRKKYNKGYAFKGDDWDKLTATQRVDLYNDITRFANEIRKQNINPTTSN